MESIDGSMTQADFDDLVDRLMTLRLMQGLEPNEERAKEIEELEKELVGI